ncbi:MAG: hypothetical protein DSZ28_06680 [Thiothrix sp.]|nr:MAG: hypothetical protein DSZ28_06680 [Thiothrix sp.]
MNLKSVLFVIISLNLLAPAYARSQSGAVMPESMTLITFNGRLAKNIHIVRKWGVDPKWFNLDGANNIRAHLYAAVPEHLRTLRNPSQDTIDKVGVILRKAATRLNPIDKNSVMVGLYIDYWGLQRVPAMVFNEGESVIYGVTDFEEALIIWQEKASSK